MAEVLGVGASVIAIIQISGQIIRLCKKYIETVQDAPSDLRLVLIETSMLKSIFDNLKFLTECNGGVSTVMDILSGMDGPIAGCHRSITDLSKLLPQESSQALGKDRSKKRRLQLTLVSLAWPLKETRAKKLLHEIQSCKLTISLALTAESNRDIKAIKTKTSKIYSILTESQRHEVHKWLQHTDPSPLHYRAQQQYESGTGDWILRSPKWASWLDAKHPCLWIHGIPGAGKTILMSHLFETVKKQSEESATRNIAHVYYYCYFGHDQDEAIPFLRWLIEKLCRQARLVPEKVYNLYTVGGQPSLVEFLQALAETIDMFEIAYVFIDAVDECNPRDDLLKVIRDLVTDPRFKKLQLLASSREYIDIERVMEDISVPQDLLEEVVDAVSAGAKGMFRWAVCQIDALQKLKNDRDVVKRALANLPRTLYETYDRIFLVIPEEERQFVRHALQWIIYHNELYSGNGIPCEVLLQAVAKSTAGLVGAQSGRFYDNETLRELCGCLISITPELKYNWIAPWTRTVSSASFAHYTVREYLDLKRNSESSPAYLASWKEDSLLRFLEIVLLEPYCIGSNEIWDFGSASYDRYERATAVDRDFNTYCAVSALLSLRNWPREISRHQTLSVLAIDLLNPTQPHFGILSSVASELESDFDYFYEEGWTTGHFWKVKYRHENNDAVHLINLLLLASRREECLAFAENFLQKKHSRAFLQTRLHLVSEVYGPTGISEYEFDGTLIEIFAQWVQFGTEAFKILLNYGAGLFDASKVLLLFIGFRSLTSEGDYLMELLVKVGADPNLTGYRITPLQIAVVSWDFDGVSALLKARAKPNGTGSSDGIVWETDSIMNRFNHLRIASHLYICRHFEQMPIGGYSMGRAKDNERIEAILLQYGAEEFLRT